MLPIRLTMAGHEYLDTIRDEEVWRRTKEGDRAVGSFSLATLGEGCLFTEHVPRKVVSSCKVRPHDLVAAGFWPGRQHLSGIDIAEIIKG